MISELPGPQPVVRPNEWRVATVVRVRVEGPGLRGYTLKFDGPVRHLAGQHYELRLTAADGYQAARLYSAASAPSGDGTLELVVALMPYGEISPYLFHYVKPGSQLELRGPFGGYFRWQPDDTRPTLLVGGGTGVVPLRAIRQAHAQAGLATTMRLLGSFKSYFDMPFKYDFAPDRTRPVPPDDVTLTFTETPPKGWSGPVGRIDAAMLEYELSQLAGSKPVTEPRYAETQAFVCGPTQFVEKVSRLLVAAGVETSLVKAERFGPTS